MWCRRVAGAVAAAVAISAQGAGAAPAAAINLRCGGDTSPARLRWLAPARGAAPTGYRLLAGDATGVYMRTVELGAGELESDGKTLAKTIPGAISNIHATFLALVAVNAAGASEPSNEKQVDPPAACPPSLLDVEIQGAEEAAAAAKGVVEKLKAKKKAQR